MNRRHFVKNSSKASLALALLGIASCKESTKKAKSAEAKMMTDNATPLFRYSLAQWSIHKMILEEQLDPFEFAAKAKSWGFEGLEYVSQLYKDYLSTHDSELAGIEAMVKRSNEESQKHGLENLILMVDIVNGPASLCDADKKVRQSAVENHHKWIDAAAGMGCHSTRINLFGSREREPWKEYAIESLSSLCEYAKAQQVNVIVENHGWLSSDAALLAEVMTQVNMDNCGTLPDFGNFCIERDGEGNWGGDCTKEYDRYQGIKELMPFAKGVSAKAYAFNENGEETTIDYAKMLQIVKESGYRGFIGVEYEGDISEEEGIIATKNLIENTIKTL